MEIKRTNRKNIQFMNMFMMMKIFMKVRTAFKGKEIVHYHQRNKKLNHHTVEERLNLQLVTKRFLGMNYRCVLLKNYPQCSILRSSGVILSPRTWPPKQKYTYSESLESVLIEMHRKSKDSLIIKCW